MSSTGISLSGLISGLDTDSMIEKLMEIEKQPLTTMQNRQKTYEYKKELWNEINTSLLSLKSSVSTLLNKSTYNSQKATVSNTNVLSASISGSAQNGTYNIEVIQLAQDYIASSDKQESAVSLSGKFMISMGSESITVSVDNADLKSIKNSINSAAEEAGLDISASIVDSRLVISGKDNLSFTDVNGSVLQSLGVINTDGEVKNEIQESQGAIFKVNGITVTKDSNEDISDVIEGVTFDLTAVGSSKITVANDVDKAVDAIKAFITQYNSTMELINTRLSEETSDSDASKGLLRGDTTLVSLKSNLRLSLSNAVQGLSGYSQITQIGINTTSEDFGKSGKLVIEDEDKLREALENDPEAVMALFAQSGDGNSAGLAQRLQSQMKIYTDSYSGIITSTTKSLQEIIDDYDDQIAAFEKRLENTESRYRSEFATMESMLSKLKTQQTWLETQLKQLSNSDD